MKGGIYLKRIATPCFLLALTVWLLPTVAFGKEDTTTDSPHTNVETPNNQPQPKEPTDPPKNPTKPEQTDETSTNWKVQVDGEKPIPPSESEENEDGTTNQSENPFMKIQISGNVKGKPVEIQKEPPSLEDIKVDTNGNVDIQSLLKGDKVYDHWKISYNGKKGTIDRSQTPVLKWKYDEKNRPVGVQVQLKAKVDKQVILVNKYIKVSTNSKKPAKSVQHLDIDYQKVKDKLRIQASLVDVTGGKGVWGVNFNGIGIEQNDSTEFETFFSEENLKDKDNRITVYFRGEADEKSVTAEKTVQFDLDANKNPIDPLKTKKTQPKIPKTQNKVPAKKVATPTAQVKNTETKPKITTIPKQTSHKTQGGVLPNTSTKYPHSILIGLLIVMGGLLSLQLKKISS